MFGIFKKGKQNNKKDAASKSQQILQEYADSRFSILNVDLNSIKLEKKPKQGNNDILTGRAKTSKIPVYTGNPFNPYF